MQQDGMMEMAFNMWLQQRRSQGYNDSPEFIQYMRNRMTQAQGNPAMLQPPAGGAAAGAAPSFPASQQPVAPPMMPPMAGNGYAQNPMMQMMQQMAQARAMSGQSPSPAQSPSMNPMMQMVHQMQQMRENQPAAAAPAQGHQDESKYADKIAELKSMGFENEKACL